MLDCSQCPIFWSDHHNRVIPVRVFLTFSPTAVNSKACLLNRKETKSPVMTSSRIQQSYAKIGNYKQFSFFVNETHYITSPIAHFTVTGGNEAGVEHALIQLPFLLCYVYHVILILASISLGGLYQNKVKLSFMFIGRLGY